MTLKYLKTATVYYLNSDTEKTFPSVCKARKAAEDYVGNDICSKPFPEEETYFYGPGNGETSVMVRQDIDISELFGRANQ